MEQTPKEKTTRLTNTEKISTSIAEITQSIALLKSALSALEKNTKRLNATVDSQNKKDLKAQSKPKKERKPCGFALPVEVSDEMCDFMGREKDTKISRIEITQFINDYIKKMSLEKPDNKQIIVPDEKLWKILGEDAKDKKLTHFTIQKFINSHFIKK